MLRKLVSKEVRIGTDCCRMCYLLTVTYHNLPLGFHSLSCYVYGREVRGLLHMLREEWEASKKSDESVLSHILRVRERLQQMSELVSGGTEVSKIMV